MRKNVISVFLSVLLVISCEASLQAQSMRMEEDYTSITVYPQIGGSVTITFRVLISPNGRFNPEVASIVGKGWTDENGIAEIRSLACDIKDVTENGFKIKVNGEVWRATWSVPDEFWLHTRFSEEKYVSYSV